jgi:hypothetical protein
VTDFDVVVPTLGRASLARTLGELARASGPAPAGVFVVDDRSWPHGPLPVPPEALALRPQLVVNGGRGPAAARNAGAAIGDAEWIAFLDDDVVPDPDWRERLARDLAGLPPDVACSVGALRVPFTDGRPTDAERNVQALARAHFVSADVAVRRSAFAALRGFDERFRRAYREDTDFFLRLRGAGFGVARGSRGATHLLRTGRFFDSVRAQAGNADDALLDAVHGRGWRRAAGERRGRFPLHALATGGLALALAARVVGLPDVARGGAILWAGLTGELFFSRALRGPFVGSELARLAVTSALIPPAAVLQRARGRLRWRGARAAPRRAPCSSIATARSSPTCPRTATRRASTPCRRRAPRSTGCAPLARASRWSATRPPSAKAGSRATTSRA